MPAEGSKRQARAHAIRCAPKALLDATHEHAKRLKVLQAEAVAAGRVFEGIEVGSTAVHQAALACGAPGLGLAGRGAGVAGRLVDARVSASGCMSRSMVIQREWVPVGRCVRGLRGTNLAEHHVFPSSHSQGLCRERRRVFHRRINMQI